MSEVRASVQGIEERMRTRGERADIISGRLQVSLCWRKIDLTWSAWLSWLCGVRLGVKEGQTFRT
jgi:hypothetical protein